MLCSYFFAFYGHRVNKKLFSKSQMISAADVGQRLLFGAVFEQASREFACLIGSKENLWMLDGRNTFSSPLDLWFINRGLQRASIETFPAD